MDEAGSGEISKNVDAKYRKMCAILHGARDFDVRVAIGSPRIPENIVAEAKEVQYLIITGENYSAQDEDMWQDLLR